jgi:phosphatidylglycerophosphate synthase
MDAMRRIPSPDRSRDTCGACLPLLWGGIALIVLAIVLAATCGSGPAVLPAALAPYLVLAGIVHQKIAVHHNHPGFGPANAATLARAILNCVFAGLLVDAALQGGSDLQHLGWFLFAITALSLSLDGIDGRLARRLKLESRFGARFDIEVDALLLTLLAGTALLLGKAGAWVLAIGGFHYAFLVARQFSPVLRRRLPASMRRKVVCALQGTALLPLLTPFVVPPLSDWIAALALLALIWSFTTDLVWLVRERPAARQGAYA